MEMILFFFLLLKVLCKQKLWCAKQDMPTQKSFTEWLISV